MTRPAGKRTAALGLLPVAVLLASCGSMSTDPLLAELESRDEQGQSVVDLAEVYGETWQHFGVACPYMSPEMTAGTLGMDPEDADDLPDFQMRDSHNALVRWNEDTLEFSEFRRTTVDVCSPDSTWETGLIGDMVTFRQNPDGAWLLS